MIFLSILILIVAKALPSCNTNLSPIIFTRISAIIFIYSGVLSFNTLYIQSIGSGIGIYSGLFHVTTVSQLLEVFLLILGSLILIAWPITPNFLSSGDRKNKNYLFGDLENLKGINILQKDVKVLYKNYQYSSEYSLIVLFSTLGSSLLISSSDLISIYLSIELQSFGLYILSTLYRDSESSTSAGLKYFLLGGLSSCLILLGQGLIYAFTGLTNLESIYSLISVSEINYIIQGLSLGIILIFVGFLFKISAAPLHNWSPDECFGKTLNWVKLSNSGDTLKLIIPNYNRKVISGQNNYLGMVTSYKMTEKEMGYRGSKSVLGCSTVKEQRVDGNYLSKIDKLRCTLTGFERDYQIKIPSKQLQKFSFSTLNNKSIYNNLNLWFITGFTDAEGCFQISIRKDKKYKIN